jgi:hypothetical protein
MAPSEAPAANVLESILTRLHESHELSVYEGIERLVKAGEEVGLDVRAMVRMLDQGMTLEELLQRIESRMESAQKAA